MQQYEQDVEAAMEASVTLMLTPARRCRQSGCSLTSSSTTASTSWTRSALSRLTQRLMMFDNVVQSLSFPLTTFTLLFTCLSCCLFQGHDAVILEDMLSHQWRPPILWVEWFRNFQFSNIKNLILEVGSINEHDVRTLIDIITLHSNVRMTTSAPPNQQGCSKLP